MIFDSMISTDIFHLEFKFETQRKHKMIKRQNETNEICTIRNKNKLLLGNNYR